MTTAKPYQSTVNPDEVAKFSAMADSWWDENGPFKPLHSLTPLRVKFIKDQIDEHWQSQSLSAQQKPLEGIRILDIGCGGGLLSEPLARMGAQVVGADASAKNIAIAKIHSENTGLSIDYRNVTAEELVISEPAFDVVCALEIIEHVADVPAFVKSCSQLIKPGGLIMVSTLNRTAASFLMAIVGAEYVMRWLPRGTHDWKSFLRPSEVADMLSENGLKLKIVQGMHFTPWTGEWSLSDKTPVNYILCAEKPE